MKLIFLNETLENNTFYYVSDTLLDGLPKPSAEGIHINQVVQGINSVKNTRLKDKEQFVYKITLKHIPKLYVANRDYGRWDAKNLSHLLLKDENIIDSLDKNELKLLNSYDEYNNGETTYFDLMMLKKILNRLGYEAISYTNEYEIVYKNSIMLFDNNLIDTCELKEGW